MDQINQLSAEALRRYFKTLSQYGYYCYGAVNKLLTLLFIQEILTGIMSDYITEADYRIMQNVLRCLYGTTCLIPYPKYRAGLDLGGIVRITFRTSEEDILRYTERNDLRVLNK